MLDKVELFIRAGRPEILPVVDQILFFLLLFFIGEGDGGFFTERRVRQYIVCLLYTSDAADDLYIV